LTSGPSAANPLPSLRPTSRKLLTKAAKHFIQFKSKKNGDGSRHREPSPEDNWSERHVRFLF
jgi:hypothetical protein